MSRTYRRTTKGNKARYLKHIHNDLNKIFNTYDRYYYRGMMHKYYEYFYEMTTPSSWVNCMETRPRRAKERNLLTKIKKEEIDPDDTSFPLDKKPHIYYW